MAAANQFHPIVPAKPEVEVSVARERQKSLLLRAWIFSGLFFMAVPGTLLGFSNLIAISSHHGFISAGLELIAVILFLRAALHHKMPKPAQGETPRRGMEPWMMSVLLGTAGLTAAVIFNFTECLLLALHNPQPSFPHALDQKAPIILVDS